MKKYRKWSTIFIIVSIFFVVFFQTVVYSAFSSSFDIDGNAYARIATDVRVTDFKISEKYTSTNGVSNYEEFNKNSISSSITFNGTGSIYYDIEITNYNSNKIGLYSCGALPSGLTYEIKDYKMKDILIDGIGTVTLTICFTGSGNYQFDLGLEFRTIYNITYEDFGGNDYPSFMFEDEEIVIDFSRESLKNISMTVSGSEYTNYTLNNKILTFGSVTGDVVITRKNSTIKLVSENLIDVGSEICVDAECFYVISSSTSNITTLAKYSLYVGGEFDKTTGVFSSYGSAATGIQNSEMKAWIPGVQKWKGVSPFSSSSQKGTNYSDYKGSIVEKYVNNYNNYLLSLECSAVEARLITYNELIKLGCDATSYSCGGAPSWVYGRAYWTQTAGSTTKIWFVDGNGGFGYSNGVYSVTDSIGVRPVIVVAKNDVADSISFTIDGVVYRMEYGMTWEEWVESAYSKGNFFKNGDTVYKYATSPYFVAIEVDGFHYSVKLSDIIDSNISYIISGSGAGN